MAMAATYFETRGNEQERDALEWLEQAGAPAVKASDHMPRTFVETYVPVNDKLDPGSGAGLRTRQRRSFPTTRPERDCVYLIWNSEVPEHLRGPLEGLCNKVTRIGHSASLVQMWLADRTEGPDPEWRPDDTDSERQMRIAKPGTLAYLQETFNQEAAERFQQFSEALEMAKGKEKSRLKREIAENFPQGAPEVVRPQLARWQGYKRIGGQRAEEAVQSGPFDRDLIILTKEDGRALGLETTLQLTSALRNAAMKAAGEDIPEWLSGHQANGDPTLKPHAAFFPLPFVGAKYADGHVMGLAIAIPRGLDGRGQSKVAVLRRVIGPLLFRETGADRIIRLWRSNTWEWRLEREKRDYPPVTLRVKTWTGPSREWASVTPVVLHHYPKRNREDDVRRILLQAFESAGLPQPAQMRVQPVSIFEGAGHARSMPEFTDGAENLCRYQVHIIVEFPVLVQGPVLVGRGRYRGYGILRPIEVSRG
jgi:CRISPR-associated protein Csb2